MARLKPCPFKTRKRWRKDESFENESTGKFEAAQLGGRFFWYVVRHEEHLEYLSHGFGADEVLELQCNLGALLRESAVLKRVCKLSFFADADQKL